MLVICLPGRGVVGIGSKSDHAPPFAHSVRTFAKANCPHRIPFNLRFLPAPMAVNEISLVQIFLQTENNVPAYSFYLKNGFHELKEHVSFAKQV